MLAGLLHKHGLWVGNADITPYKNTNSAFGSENTEIKTLMKSLAESIDYKNWSVPLPQLDSVGERAFVLRDRISEIVPDQTPWLVKTAWTLIFGDLWVQMFPNAKWLFITRPIDDIVDSVNRHPMMGKRRNRVVKKFIKALHDKQHELSLKPIDYLFVDINFIIEKDPVICKNLFAFCDVVMNTSVFDEWIKPDMWHGDRS
jgi:hypothetical protein